LTALHGFSQADDMTRDRSRKAEAGLVSVVIPAYNYAQFVTQAIESVKSQDYPNVEIIVVDDGSTDDTQAILEKRTDIRYIRQENRGLSAARNRGIDAASGEFILFFDADDLLGRDSVRKRVDALRGDRSLSFVVCRSRYFNAGRPETLSAFLLHEWELPRAGTVDLALCFFNIAPPHAFLVRKACIDRHALRFDTQLRACEDYDFWFRLSLLTSPPRMVRNASVYYRQHASSMSRARANQSRHDAILCERVLAAFETPLHWLGNRVRFNYLYPMFASALLTTRRLWWTDKEAFTTFFVAHVADLRRRLSAFLHSSALDADCIEYIALCRLSALRMLVRDRSIGGDALRDLIGCLPDRIACVRSLLRRGPTKLPVLARYLLSELRYFVLYSLYRRRFRN
jgi:glycosyltransferase involved in cell wall biosynthesis